MASYACVLATHQTLAAGVVDTVTLSPTYPTLEVFNRDSAATIYFRVDGVTPTVAGADCYVLPPNNALAVPFEFGSQVQLISSAVAAYSVTGFPS